EYEALTRARRARCRQADQHRVIIDAERDLAAVRAAGEERHPARRVAVERRRRPQQALATAIPEEQRADGSSGEAHSARLVVAARATHTVAVQLNTLQTD